MVELMKNTVTGVDILRQVINIIFDKALEEPGYSTLYAELCRVLEKHCPTFENAEGKPQVKLSNVALFIGKLIIPCAPMLQTFKRILLNRCQEAFEQKPQEEITDSEKKAEDEVKQKRRMLGSMLPAVSYALFTLSFTNFRFTQTLSLSANFTRNTC